MPITVSKRHPKRVRVMLDSLMESAQGRGKVRIRDISQNGMLVETEGPHGVGKPLKLFLGSHQIEGKTVWQDGTFCGVVLDRPMDALLWDSVSSQQLVVSMPRQYRFDRAADDHDMPIEMSPRVISFPQAAANSN